MNKIDTALVLRVLRNMSRTLDENLEYVPTILNTLVMAHHNALEEGDVFSYLAATNLLTTYIRENSNQETLDIIASRLVENKTMTSQVTKYDLSSPEDFLKAMQDEIIREMVSGASIGGRMSGLGNNNQVNATGMAGTDPVLKKKKKNNKIVNVLNKRL